MELLQYDPPRPLESAGSPAQVGTVHIALTVSDLDRVLELCAGHGWRPVGTPHRMTGGARAGTRIVYLEGALGGFLELSRPHSSRSPRRLSDLVRFSMSRRPILSPAARLGQDG
ncbi:VOC family protein [Rathayibacter sp. AY1B1]|uniref:VOC family protein n=1 Tax=Rathayibacter sp. AY1B1 TaxID=2080528 RepID=UPI0035BE7D71